MARSRSSPSAQRLRGHDAARRRGDARPARHRGLHGRLDGRCAPARLHDQRALLQRRRRGVRSASAATPISRRGACASSAMPASASARTTCASCASSASPPNMAKARRTPGLDACVRERAGLARAFSRTGARGDAAAAGSAARAGAGAAMLDYGLIVPVLALRRGPLACPARRHRGRSCPGARCPSPSRGAGRRGARGRGAPAGSAAAFQRGHGRLVRASMRTPAIGPGAPESAARAYLYADGEAGYRERMLLAWARSGDASASRPGASALRCPSAGSRRVSHRRRRRDGARRSRRPTRRRVAARARSLVDRRRFRGRRGGAARRSWPSSDVNAQKPNERSSRPPSRRWRWCRCLQVLGSISCRRASASRRRRRGSSPRRSSWWASPIRSCCSCGTGFQARRLSADAAASGSDRQRNALLRPRPRRRACSARPRPRGPIAFGGLSESFTAGRPLAEITLQTMENGSSAPSRRQPAEIVGEQRAPAVADAHPAVEMAVDVARSTSTSSPSEKMASFSLRVLAAALPPVDRVLAALDRVPGIDAHAGPGGDPVRRALQEARACRRCRAG